MRQVFQSLRSGEIDLADVPCPAVAPGHVLIRTRASLISAGTERMLLEFGKASWLQKARQQPDKVRQVLEKARTDGVAATWDAVRSKLDEPLSLGYCNVGTVMAVGRGVEHVQVGDRVASNGKHAEVVSVPKHLCVRIPDGVSDEAAVFTVVGAIGLQGIRLAQPALGECVAVTGLGLIGLLTVQLLSAAGCRVLGIDFSSQRLEMARRWGAETVDLSKGEDPVARAEAFSRGRGMDAVLITAATDSDEPMHQAALMCRQRGRIVLVGVTGLKLSRNDFYKKELSFQVSCSYGPGRYDPQYEEGGSDYPVGFVRWTEQRNFEAVLDAMSDGRIDSSSLVTHRFRLDDAAQAYELIAGRAPSLGVVINYPTPQEQCEDVLTRRTVDVVRPDAAATSSPAATATATSASATSANPKSTRETPSSTSASPRGAVRVAFVGAGNYATRMLMPAFRAAGAELSSVVSRGGATSLHAARKFGFRQATTDWRQVLDDRSIDAVVIATQHDSHARFVCEAIRAGKHVYAEKPLALRSEEINEIAEAVESAGAAPPKLMVGFNRRFAPHVVKARELLRGVAEPKSMLMTVNAGAIPLGHWVHDPVAGGGRVVGEACHFVDLLRHLAGSPIAEMHAVMLGGPAPCDDKVICSLRFADGSIGAIHYLANGHRGFPKERLEIFAGGRVVQLDNFRRLTAFGCGTVRGGRLWRQDKGQQAAAAAFLTAIRDNGPSPIPTDELFEVASVCLDITPAAREGRVCHYTTADAVPRDQEASCAETEATGPLVETSETRRSA